MNKNPSSKAMKTRCTVICVSVASVAVVTTVAIVAAIVVFFVVFFGLIQLRLTRNGEVVNHLVESLHERYPGVTFNGAASYDKEVVYVQVEGMADPAARTELEQWLAAQKRERGLDVEIWLRYTSDNLEVKL